MVEIRHWPLLLARSVLVRGHPCCWAHGPRAIFFHVSIEQVLGCLAKEVDSHPWSLSFSYLITRSLLWGRCPLVGICSIGTDIFIVCDHSESSAICYTQIFLLPIFYTPLLSLQSSSQIVTKCQWINVKLHFKPSLTPDKMVHKVLSTKHFLEPGTRGWDWQKHC